MRLQDLRKEKKLTQKRASEIIGCHHKYISYIEKKMDDHLFIQYLKLLRNNGLDLNQFFDEKITLINHLDKTE